MLLCFHVNTCTWINLKWLTRGVLNSLLPTSSLVVFFHITSLYSQVFLTYYPTFPPRLMCFMKTPDTVMCKWWEGLYWTPHHFFYPPSWRWLEICKLRRVMLKNGLMNSAEITLQKLVTWKHQKHDFFYKITENQRCKLLINCLLYLYHL